jgi:hypothetical protein
MLDRLDALRYRYTNKNRQYAPPYSDHFVQVWTV